MCDCLELPVDRPAEDAGSTDTQPEVQTPSDAEADVGPPDDGPACAPFASVACSGDDHWWFDGCGEPAQLMQECLEFQACGEGGCPVFPGFCFGDDCPTVCDLLSGEGRKATPAPIGNPFVPVITATSDTFELTLPAAGDSEFGGVFRLQAAHRLVVEPDVPFALTAFGDPVEPNTETPAACGTAYDVPSGSYEITLGPTSSATVKLLVNPQTR